jgi:hypothetical protein
MGRIRIEPTGPTFKLKVEEWLQSLTDRDFDFLAARRDLLVGRLEAIYRRVSGGMEAQT